MRILLVDDEPLALERLRALFRDVPNAEIVGEGSNGREALDAIAALKPDLVMLDIQMPDFDGLTVARMMPAEERPEIIYITAFGQYAADAFTVEASDYLLKPVQPDRLRQAIERAKRRRYLRSLDDVPAQAPPSVVPAKDDRADEGIWVPTRDAALFVPFASVDWIEAQRDYVILHTSTRSHIVRIAMRALEQRLAGDDLMRVHRSAFARPSNVREVRRLGRVINGLVMRDGAVVPVGPNYASDVAQKLGF
ncbi:LytR/AlgR family response regulator transcription factor [Allosphingosinicella vermicomposti]|uniref:LytR/AlgR family response regulator transcription factor n=1 Tax=Allosphingosinicella vermicomposti TaxID=614671 RepID=UPI000D10F3EA|nr:LytTR family DNA-binding domain-containing protein [Allosphingosinicella vermicomposti]